jgi:hypothetical protein
MSKASVSAYDSRERRLSKVGAKRIEAIIQPEVLLVLHEMVRQGWADSMSAAINKAIMAQVDK